MTEFTVNKEKTLHALLYICNSQGGSCNMYNLLKVVFFADSDHLFKFGRPITGDRAHSMKYGPVPSVAYNMVKPGAKPKYFSVEENIVEAKVAPNLDLFSESDLECLKKSISENINLDFPTLRDKSHTPSYEKTRKEKGLDKPMSFLDIAKEDGKVSEDMLAYITSRFA